MALSYCIRLLFGSFEATMISVSLKSTGPPVYNQGKLRRRGEGVIKAT